MHSRLFITFNPPRARLQLSGKLDAGARGKLQRRLEDAVRAGCVRVEVDCTAVTFIDVGCVLELELVRDRLADLGHALVVRRSSAAFDGAVILAGCPDLYDPRRASPDHRSLR